MIKNKVIEGIVFGLNQDFSSITGTYITFYRYKPAKKRITKIWRVDTSSTPEGITIGWIKWFGRWRKYSFFPNNNTVYEETCMREIAHFCESATKLHSLDLKVSKNIYVSVS